MRAREDAGRLVLYSQDDWRDTLKQPAWLAWAGTPSRMLFPITGRCDLRYDIIEHPVCAEGLGYGRPGW